MSLAAKIVIALLLVVAGFAGGIKYHAGQDAVAARKADESRQSDSRQQRRLVDQGAGKHAAELAHLSTQLGNAREKISRLSGRDCLAPDIVGVLNDIGDQSVRTAAVDPARATSTTSTGTGLRFSTDADAANAIAICRARYAEVSSQLNQILDIEAHRHPEFASQ